MKNIISLLTLVVLLSSCELYKQDSYEEYYVVESYLVAGGSLPPVRLSTTSPIEKKYTFEETALSNARVQIRLLNRDSTISSRYEYRETNKGIYIPKTAITVRDQRLYQLHITTGNGDVITSTTYVPGNFDKKKELQDRYLYQGNEQIEIRVTPSSYITNRQTYYIFTVNVVRPAPYKLTPFYKSLVFDQENKIENYYVNSSGIINEKSYERNTDNTISLKVPWLAIAFYQDNDIIVNAIDDNMYDFLRSQRVQTGGSNMSPGEIQNIRYNIDGGIGIFGSMASDTMRVYISSSSNSK